ncbi:hypothetical protein RVR_6021 [Actinacidiphila reveromycinica]|uniref:Zinc-ribbon domain-containing protein n=1 Tax=Actinacidiphila reveromycinica TaxID=659352 RepID=A0A7U3UVB8_9ACTN|nr:zinc ribbon domain-containing protein [Streptomyces sp. SN-593]BBA99415.1 hypothetical protein RVR_6021 [Streptomyces sp. SN-593]
MPFCPACGNQVAEAEGNRFCPRCGRDLTAPSLPAQPPTAAPAPPQVGSPPPPPPPPPYGAPPGQVPLPPGPSGPPGFGPGYPPPAPVGPSPAAVFVRRVFTGRWEGPLLVALGPALTVVAAALAIAGAAGAALPSGTIGMATRTRAALAALVQGLGGNLHASTTYTDDDVFGDSDDGDGDDDPSDGGSDGFDFSDGGSDGFDDGSDGGSDGFDDGSDGYDDGSDGFDDGSDGFDDGSDGYDTDGSDGYDSDGSDGYDDGSDGYDSGSDGADGSDIGYTMSGSGGDGHSHTLHASFSVLPWTVTLVWVLVLVLGLRALRRRQLGAAAAAGAAPEATADSAAAAVRVALLAAAAVLAIGFFAEPHIGVAHFTTAPFLAALWTFVLSLVTALVVLCRPALNGWLAARPGAAATYRVAATTAIALLATLFVAGVAVFVIAAAHYHDLTGWGVAAAALLLVNLGVSGLGLGWGAPFRLGTGEGSSARHVSFGLGDLDHVWGGWSVAGTVAGGLCCALLIGVLAVRRNRGRPEQFAVAALFTVLLVVLAAVSGAHTGGDEGSGLGGVLEHSSAHTEVPQLLGLGLLWTFGGVLVAPYVWRVFGGRMPPAAYAEAGAPSPYAPGGTYGGAYGAAPGAAPTGAPGAPGAVVPPQPAPPAGAYGPPQPPGPAGPAEPTVHDLGVVEPDRLRKQPPDHR